MELRGASHHFLVAHSATRDHKGMIAFRIEDCMCCLVRAIDTQHVLPSARQQKCCIVANNQLPLKRSRNSRTSSSRVLSSPPRKYSASKVPKNKIVLSKRFCACCLQAGFGITPLKMSACAKIAPHIPTIQSQFCSNNIRTQRRSNHKHCSAHPDDPIANMSPHIPTIQSHLLLRTSRRSPPNIATTSHD